MNSLLTPLLEFGLSKKQAELFLTIAEYGAKPASFFAKILKTERTNCYKTALTLVEKGLVQQNSTNGTTIFFVSDKEIFRKQLLQQQQQISQQEKLLPLLEQGLLQLEQEHHSPIPKMKFYQGVAGVTSCFEQLSQDIFRSGLLQITCFATNTLESRGLNFQFKQIQQQFLAELKKRHITLNMTIANGIQLLEQISVVQNSDILSQLPTGNGAVQIFLIHSTIYIIIYKSIPVALQIESEELTEVMYFMMKHVK